MTFTSYRGYGSNMHYSLLTVCVVSHGFMFPIYLRFLVVDAKECQVGKKVVPVGNSDRQSYVCHAVSSVSYILP